jgi:hypothetical protein
MLSHLQGGPTEDNLGDDFLPDYHDS